MKKKFKIGVIGCGDRAVTFVKAAVLSDFLSEKKIIVSDLIEEKLDKIGDELGVFTCNSNKYVAENSEFLFITVGKQHFEGVLKSLGDFKPQKVISLTAGITKNFIKARLGTGVSVAVCMANLPCAIGSGVICADMSDFEKDVDDVQFIQYLLGNAGQVMAVGESRFAAAESLSVNGPAFAFMLIDSLIDSGIRAGLTTDEARVMAVQTVLGSAEMLLKEDSDIPELITKVCEKGSAAVEAVKVLELNDFRGTVAKAVDAGVKRSKEISQK